MKRFVRAAAAAAVLAGGLGSLGCFHRTGATHEDRYRNAVDTSWPDRYNYAARQAVLAPFAQQAANGHFLHQTIWNWYFEQGTDKLTAAGREKLDSLARATPHPDPRIYLQAARDVQVTPENIDKIHDMRDDLTAKRAAAVQKYLNTQPGNPVAYELYVHDSPVPGIDSTFAGNAWRGQRAGYVGGISSGGVGVTATGSGAAPTSGTTTGGAGTGGTGTGGTGGVGPTP